MIVFCRLFLSMVLLGLVWLNAHWSVALAITLLAINAEMSTLYVRRLTAGLRMFFPGSPNGDQRKEG